MNSQLISSSATKNNSEERTRAMAKSEDEQVEKKLKEDLNDDKDGQGQVEVEGRCFLDELPPEMLLKILKNVDSKILLSLRVQNRNLNGIASEILRSRSDRELHFDCYKTDKGKLVIENKSRKRSLADFNECFANSVNFPYSRFRFNKIDWSLFRNRSWTKFLSTFGENIKHLKLQTKKTSVDSVVIKLMDKLRDLLLNQLPELEEFGLDLDHKPSSKSSTINLFPSPAENTGETASSTTTLKTSTTVRLPHLKALYLNCHFTLRFPGIATDLLDAAVNLQKIDFFCYSCEERHDFPFLQSVGKVGCVQEALMRLTPQDLSKMKETSTAPLAFKLKELMLCVQRVYEEPSSWPDATIFLSNLFESSKDTLTEMNIDSMGFLKNLKLPKFSKLTTLKVGERFRDKIHRTIFPSGLKLAHVFPVLRSFKLDTAGTFPQDYFASIPSLNSLEVTNKGLNGEIIAQFAVMFPYLKDFKIYGGGLKNFHQVGTAIWTHMKQLKSLSLSFDVGARANAFPAIDSCITGFSTEYCQHLYDLFKLEESFEETEDVQVTIPQSELDFEAERKNPSILDLKELENLTLWLFRLSFDSEDRDEDLLEKAITGVSQIFAFQFMDKCRSRIFTF